MMSYPNLMGMQNQALALEEDEDEQFTTIFFDQELKDGIEQSETGNLNQRGNKTVTKTKKQEVVDNDVLVLRLSKSKQNQYTYTNFLIKFSFTLIVLSFIIMILNTILFLNYDQIQSFNVPPAQSLFRQFKQNLEIHININQKNIYQILILVYIFQVITIVQYLLIISELKPLRSQIKKQAKPLDMKIQEQKDEEQINQDGKKEIEKQETQKKKLIHEKAKMLQQKILIISIINLVVLALILFYTFIELSHIVSSWLDQNIQGQDFDNVSIDKLQKVETLKKEQRAYWKKVITFIFLIINISVLFIYGLVSIVSLYATHQLSRNIKRTEEEEEE